ncbi:sugar phosphate isomerase/epimerase [Vibrio sp. SCSIO 43132]|uniref:sugar phosphate isomerase/epimerase family protein n=1 Tax=Vibrio sp. SCSIO 43132 TaxID=2779363 RepID=UPI001CA861FA|nr:sugar phosphate isomerase/epimerase [Vibrio sp. SCSIO 43132]UAB71314.1 sugar phosphate isomerase/epimerase [Vibrio sp. SCSIO 43132]
MGAIKGPGIFLAQFAGEKPPFNTLENITKWAASLGYKGVQIPTFVPHLFDLETAATSQTYCDDIAGVCAESGVEITELSTHLQGQLIAVNPAYDKMFDGFAPSEVKGKTKERTQWATDQLMMAAKASQRLGLNTSVSFSGSLAFPYFYPWPQRPQGLINEAFSELAKRWKPILDEYENCGVDLGFEIHPGEDLFDGATFEMFLDHLNQHPRAQITYDPSHFLLQQLDYLAFIDLYHERICAFHVKDAEFNPDGRQGVYSGYQDWSNRAGRFRSVGDGQIDFSAIFSKLTQYGFNSWAVLEWECCIKSSEQGAAEGAPFIARHIIQTSEHAFDDFASSDVDKNMLKSILGID